MPQWVEGPLVGRTAELARLREHVERARAGRPSAVLVAGDAGVGKTRLLAAAAGTARERGLRVLTGHCLDLGDVGLPYLPFVDLLRPLREDPPPAATHPAVAPLLAGAASAPSPAGEGGRLPLFEGVAALLAELAAAQPLLLVLEDPHWADRSSRDLLRYLLTRLVAEPVLVVASYRSDDLHRRYPLRPLLAELVRVPGVERLDLPPLPDAEPATLLLTAGSAGIESAVWRADPSAAVTVTERTVRRLREIWPLDFLVAVRLVAVALGPVADAAAVARAGGDTDTAARWVASGERLAGQAREAREAQELFADHVGEARREGRAWAGRLDAELDRLRGVADPFAWAAVTAAFGPEQVYEQARCRWREAEALLATGDRAGAAGRLRASHTAAVALGARPLRERLEALARRSRLDAGLPGVRVVEPAAVFTPREAEVLGLVARGLTNRQIGAELYTSEKTASVHLSRVLAKLGVSGRTEAVAVAAERGLLP